MDQENPRESTNYKVLIEEDLAEPVYTRRFNSFHVTKGPAPNLSLHLFFLQIHTDKSTKLFEVVILDGGLVGGNTHNELQLFTTDGSFGS